MQKQNRSLDIGIGRCVCDSIGASNDECGGLPSSSSPRRAAVAAVRLVEQTEGKRGKRPRPPCERIYELLLRNPKNSRVPISK